MLDYPTERRSENLAVDDSSLAYQIRAMISMLRASKPRDTPEKEALRARMGLPITAEMLRAIRPNEAPIEVGNVQHTGYSK